MPSHAMSKTSAFTGPSFSWQNRVARQGWNWVYLILFRPSPRWCHGWRSFLLRRFGAQIGRGCHIYPKAAIWAPWNLICGDGACIADHVTVYSQATITLGYRSVISQGSHLCTGTHNYESPRFELVAWPIEIGPHAWVCAESFVGPGVSIGEGSVIGARSVVMKDMPKWMVCAGHPCRPVKPRVLREDEGGIGEAVNQ